MNMTSESRLTIGMVAGITLSNRQLGFVPFPQESRILDFQ